MPETTPEPEPDFYFRGFHGPRYTQTPDEIFDELLAPGVLTEAELRVLRYIMRRTFGWKKDSDAISLSQLTDGIVRRDGTRLDTGAGVKRAAAWRAVQGLERKGIIVAERGQSVARGHETNIYSLRMADSPPQDRKDPRLGSQRSQGRIANSATLESSATPQETPVQETLIQEDNSAGGSAGEPVRYSGYIAAVVFDHARELGAEPRGPRDLPAILALWTESRLDEAAFVWRLHAARDLVRKQQRPGVDRWSLYLQIMHAG